MTPGQEARRPAGVRGYANPALLWSPETLKHRLGAPGLAVVDIRRAEAFARGHIPGARHFDVYFVNTYDTDPAPLASFTRMWADLLGWRGVGPGDTVVFAGQFSDMSAARGFWFAEYLGHRDVHVLDGGMDAWRAAGLPEERDGEAPEPVKYAYDAVEARVAGYRHVLDGMDDAGTVIVDTRSPEEYRGTDVRAARGGAVPGAVHRDWVDLYDHASGCMRPAADLRRAFESVGATPDKQIIVYCNTGYRSAHAYLALRLLGYPRVRNYVSSWQEWAARPELPVRRPD